MFRLHPGGNRWEVRISKTILPMIRRIFQKSEIAQHKAVHSFVYRCLHEVANSSISWKVSHTLCLIDTVVSWTVSRTRVTLLATLSTIVFPHEVVIPTMRNKGGLRSLCAANAMNNPHASSVPASVSISTSFSAIIVSGKCEAWKIVMSKCQVDIHCYKKRMVLYIWV